ncbi:MAG: hypothetical protein AAF360_14120 [Pseudomonadota bacterium]
MTINPYIDPNWAWFANFAILFCVFLVIIFSGVFIGHAYRQIRLSDRYWAIVFAPLALALWAGAAIATSLSIKLQIYWFLPFALAPILLGTAASFSRVGARLLAETPTHWMIALQSYRVLGALFLFPYMAQGVLTPGFAWPAGVGDVITGVAAPFVALCVLRDPQRWRGLFYAWTFFGIADLIVAPLSAVIFGFGAEGRQLTFAVTAIPLFLGPPFGILIHILTWRSFELRRKAA